MLFVALYSILAIYILYGGDCDLFTKKPKVTCERSYKSLLKRPEVLLFKLYPIVGIHDMLGTNEMKGFESLHE
jgi:hypothetical protein